MRWLDAAWKELGQKEISGAGANPEILNYFREDGRGDITSDEVAWCAAFCGACLQRGGISIAAIPPAERLLANSYLKIGTPISEPRVGAICVLSRGSDVSQGHVGFVIGVTADQVVLLGGNQADSVSTAHFSRSRIRGLRWPETVAPATVDQTSRIARAAKQVQKDTAKTATTQMLPAPDAIAARLDAAMQSANGVATTAKTATEALPSHEVLAGKAMMVKSSIETAIEFSTFVSAKWGVVMLAVGGYWVARIAWNSALIRKWRHEDAATGKTPEQASTGIAAAIDLEGATA